jgi:LPXTG-motif cell wall-anchored protein
MRYVVRSARKVGALMAVAMLGILMMAMPVAAQTSTITQADCDAGRITQNGKTISGSACEARIGQKVNLASTGFEAWMLGVGGVVLMGGAAVVLMRRRPMRTLA